MIAHTLTLFKYMALEGLNLALIQKGDEDEFRKVFERFGCRIERRPTCEEVKFYSFEKLLPKQEEGESAESYKERCFRLAEGIVLRQLESRNMYYKVFGPDENGEGFKPPKFGEHHYETGCVWIFQPRCPESAGSLNPAYNLLWSVSHELAHAFTNGQMTERFGGVGKRRGALGIETRGNTFSEGQGKQKPLSLVDALRATEWEHVSTLLQRDVITEDYGIEVTDDEFVREYQYNIAGSVIRTLWGQFTTPGALGVIPQETSQSPDEMNRLAQDMYREAAEKMGLDMEEDFR